MEVQMEVQVVEVELLDTGAMRVVYRYGNVELERELAPGAVETHPPPSVATMQSYAHAVIRKRPGL
jgi:hypothetical protein